SRTTPPGTSTASTTSTSGTPCRAGANGRATTARSGSTTVSTARQAPAPSPTGPASPAGAAALRLRPPHTPPAATHGLERSSKHLTTAASQLPWPGGSADDFVFNVDAFGLYKFTSTFTDALSGQTTTNSFYRPIGDIIKNNFQGVWGGVVGRQTGTIYLDHDG